MKIKIIGIAILITVFMLPLLAQQNKYVGAKGCTPCHTGDKKGKQAEIWKASKHAEAYTTLTMPKALEIAKAKGIANPAESKECIECHSLGTTVDAALLDKTFDIKLGVQCETCHDAGSAFKSMSVMKDKEKAFAAGLHKYDDVKAIEAKCRTCHNEKSPSFKEFKFDEMWAKIQHKKP